jgi:hypothetical protein
VAAFFDDFDWLKRHRRNEAKNESASGDERHETGGQLQGERVERPRGGVIVVGVFEFRTAAVVIPV